MNFEKYNFLYNAAAHFEAQSKFPDGLFKAISEEGTQGLKNLCFALELLSTQGELVRRDMGYDKTDPLYEDIALHSLTLRDVIEAKRIVYKAISDGLKAPEQEEIDEVLLENQKKKGSD